MGNINNEIEDYLYPERKVQRIQEMLERRRAEAVNEAKNLSDRELLEEIYVALKTRLLL